MVCDGTALRVVIAGMLILDRSCCSFGSKFLRQRRAMDPTVRFLEGGAIVADGKERGNNGSVFLMDRSQLRTMIEFISPFLLREAMSLLHYPIIVISESHLKQDYSYL